MNIPLLLLAGVINIAPKVGAIEPAIEVTGPVLIEWILVDDVGATCRERLNRSYPFINACSQWTSDKTGRKCFIYTSKTKTTLDDLGHELRHCFEGHFHP